MTDLTPPQGPEYMPCGCGHIEPEHRPDAGACWGCGCESYRPTVPHAGLVAVPPTSTDRAALRDRIVQALYEARRPGLGGMTEADAVAYMAAAVLAVLPAGLVAGSEDTTTTRADTLREAADHLAKQADELWAPETTAHTVMHADAAELRRLAAETQPSEPETGPDRRSGCRFVPCGDCCPACSAGIEHTEHCPTPESHNWGCGCPSDRLPLHAASGVDTPGCDCGHNGMGSKWHGATCEWMSIPPCDHCGRRGHSFEDCPSADEPAASAGVQTDTAPEPPQRSRTARFLDALTHSGPGYDLTPDADVHTDEETSR